MVWWRDIPHDLARIEIVSVRLAERPSVVVAATFAVHRTDGTVIEHERRIEPPVLYETLVDRVRQTNREIVRMHARG